jgi:hypothetical protein
VITETTATIGRCERCGLTCSTWIACIGVFDVIAKPRFPWILQIIAILIILVGVMGEMKGRPQTRQGDMQDRL